MTPRRKKIMIVDDDLDYLRELSEMLSASGYQPVICNAGEYGLDYARLFAPDVILLDLKMQPKSGLQLADELKHQYDTYQIPLLAMTGYYTHHEHVYLMKTCGIVDCLEKPFTVTAAIDKIERALAEVTA